MTDICKTQDRLTATSARNCLQLLRNCWDN